MILTEVITDLVLQESEVHMRDGKKPTVRQKKLMTSLGLNCENWLVRRDNDKEFVIVHRHTGNVRRLER